MYLLLDSFLLSFKVLCQGISSHNFKLFLFNSEKEVYYNVRSGQQGFSI